MRYCDSISVAAGTSDVFTKYIFRASSINDPDYTGTGHQPHGHDTWEQLYNHYRVLGAKITVVATKDESVTGEMTVFLRGADKDYFLGGPTTASEMMEQPGCQYRRLTTAHPTAKMSHKYSAKSVFRNTKNAELTALFNANPDENWFFPIYLLNTFAGDTPTKVNLQVQIDYICQLTEPKTLGQS